MTNTLDVLGQRSAGVLLHVTSLPSPAGIGDLGPAAYAWVDMLMRHGITWWQVLPVGQIGAGNSPYQSPASIGCNTLLISLDRLKEDGLLSADDVAACELPPGDVDYPTVQQRKGAALALAWQNYQAGHGQAVQQEFEEFLHDKVAWIDEFALFMAIKESRHGASFFDWPADLRLRKPAAMGEARQEFAPALERIRFEQFLAYRQWMQLKQYANAHGVKIIGDLPIFVSGDSLDVWQNPEYFLLDANHRPTWIAGVPPDYFSPTGQLWGNPVYNWDVMRADGFAWWVGRLEVMLRLFDVVRLDHFRGFEAAWYVPAGAETAEAGHWEPGPGADLLSRLRGVIGSLPLIAEDLGLITPAVSELRDRFSLPGMRVLQFAFDGLPDNPFLPHNYVPNTVVYTGTHDNDTTVGWFASLTEEERHVVRERINADGTDIAWDMIKLAWGSVAELAVVPLQDVLMLDSSARMNRPGTMTGNWGWRYTPDQPVEAGLAALAEVTRLSNRWRVEA
ncbi:MAG TPA: 4-alpha-glucanotransferase [Pirellulaceae bacterium]|nr:4-alpha-glucanotransferase [Pirellulaceae bacterium]